MRPSYLLLFLAVSAAAQAQTTSSIAIGGASTAPADGWRGPGLPTVPNNSLAPLPNPTVSAPGVAPDLRPTTPGLNAAATAGVIIQLPPPAVLAPPTPDAVRTCPSGITFC